jgi:hypothetical protein
VWREHDVTVLAAFALLQFDGHTDEVSNKS